MMKKLLSTLAIAMAFASPSFALDTPHGVVLSLFDGMRAGDGNAIRPLVLPDAKLDRLRPDGTIQQGTFERWASWVDTLEEGAADEQIFGVKTFAESEDLATVWAPFIVSLNGEVKGCGVNQFTLARTAEGWRVLYGIDKPTKENCADFRARFTD